MRSWRGCGRTGYAARASEGERAWAFGDMGMGMGMGMGTGTGTGTGTGMIWA